MVAVYYPRRRLSSPDTARGFQARTSDNGPEFIAKAIQGWLGSASVETLYVAPGSPWENGYAEAFHSRLRDEFLNMEAFASVKETQALANMWRDDYNQERPHSSLGYLTPVEFRERCGKDVTTVGSDACEPRALRLSL